MQPDPVKTQHENNDPCRKTARILRERAETMKSKVFRWKFMLPMILGALIMSVAFSLISYFTFRDVEMEDCEDYTRGLTWLIADDIIDAEKIDVYLEQGRNAPDYNEIENKLYHLREAYPDVLYLYVYQIHEDGWHVVFDLDTEEFKGSEPGTVQEFFPAYREYIPDLLAGKEVPAIVSNEDYGYVLTVCTPLYDGNGVCKCYICADCSMEKLKEYVWNIIRQIICFFLIVLAVMLVIGFFVTDRGVVRQVKNLENRAYRDTLTGLQNRTAYYDYNRELTRKMEAGDADYSILMIDVNFLKKMNDVYGHEQGNLYLQGAADLIRRIFGDEHVYRIGGDEFVVILEGRAQEGIEGKIKAFKDEIARLQADDSLQPWEKISAAAGIAKYEKDAHREPEEVLRKADEAMYADKLAMKAVRKD